MKKIIIPVTLGTLFLGYITYQKFIVENAPIASQSISKKAMYSLKDGEYTSRVGDAFFGPLQIKLVINSGKISDVKFLQFPSDRETSVEISNQALPILKQEAISAQNSNVDIVTGATQTSKAFQTLLEETLAAAKA